MRNNVLLSPETPPAAASLAPTASTADEPPPLMPTKSWRLPAPGQKWAREPRTNGSCEMITIIILVLFFGLGQINDAIGTIVAMKQPCCESLLANATTCPTATDGGAACCVAVDSCVANDACLSTCVFDSLGFSLAQFAPGPAGAFLEAFCFIAVVVALVICGLIGRGVDRAFAPKHETLTCSGAHPSLCPLTLLIGPFVSFCCVTIAANVGVHLVMDAAQLLLLVFIAVPIWLLCTPFALCSSIPSFRFVRHVQIEDQKRQTVLAGLSAMSLCTGPEAKDARDTLSFYMAASAKLLLRPSPVRLLTFVNSLAAVLFYSAWPALVGLMWFMVRLFAAATLSFFNPPQFWKEYGHAVRQRKRVGLMAYPNFWASDAYRRHAAEIGASQGGAELASAELKEQAQEQVDAQIDALKEAVTDAGGVVAAAAESGHAALVVEGGSAKAAVVRAAGTAGVHVTSELAGVLWEGAPMPPVMENLLPVLCDIVGETLFLIIFVVKAAGLTEAALQTHNAMAAKRKPKSARVGVE